MSVLRRGVFAVVGLGSIIAVAVSAPVTVLGANTPGYSLANVGAYGGEPSIVSDSLGQLYDTTPSGGTIAYTSTSHGKTWTQVTTALRPTSQMRSISATSRAVKVSHRSRPMFGSQRTTEIPGPMARARYLNARPAALHSA